MKRESVMYIESYIYICVYRITDGWVNTQEFCYKVDKLSGNNDDNNNNLYFFFKKNNNNNWVQ